MTDNVDVEYPSFVNPLMYTDFGDEVRFTNDTDGPTTFIPRHPIDITACESGDDIQDAIRAEAVVIAKMYDDEGAIKPEYVEEFYYLDDVGAFSSDVDNNYIALLELGLTQLHEEVQVLALRTRMKASGACTWNKPGYEFVQGPAVEAFLAWYFGDDQALTKPSTDSQLDTWVADLITSRQYYPPTMHAAFSHFLGCLKSRLHDYEYPKVYRKQGGAEADLGQAKELSGPFGVF